MTKKKAATMALTATVDLSTPGTITATAVSDKRLVSVTVAAVGETATATGEFPITFSDTAGRTYTKKTDDGTTAVYTAPA